MATTSAPHEPHEPLEPLGRPGDGAAAARTEQLYAEFGRTVSGLCGSLLRNRSEAEDATQQTFLSAHRALLNGTDPREPAAWLATIARNECWGRIRARMREPLATEEIEAPSTMPDPLAEAIRRADLAALWSAIQSLPVQQRDALLLREFGGLSYGELARALSVSGPAVESLLFRARQRLRAQLRTAYASLTGASWLEALTRLFAGGGAPVAAKVAALGVGAAAVSGGAVVAPHVLENHHSRSHPPARTAPRQARRTAAAPAVGAPAVASVQRVAVVPPVTAAGGGDAAGGDETTTVSERSSGPSQDVSASRGSDGADGPDGGSSAAGAPATSARGRSSVPEGGDAVASGRGSGDGSGHGSGSSGSGGSDSGPVGSGDGGASRGGSGSGDGGDAGGDGVVVPGGDG